MRTRLNHLFPGSAPRVRLGLALTVTITTLSCSQSPASGAFQPSGTIGDASAPPAPTAAPAVSAPSGGQVDRVVLERYREYQRVYKQVFETNDPVPLGAVATDPLLSSVTGEVEQARTRGEVWRFTNVLNPRIQGRSRDGTKVFVLDCVRTLGARRYSAKSGQRLGSLDGGTALYQVIMTYDAGVWKASNATLGKKC